MRSQEHGPNPRPSLDGGSATQSLASSDSVPTTSFVAAASTDPAAAHDVPLSRLGRFVINERIGRGGFGEVYKAYDPRLDRLVAVKVARGHRLDDPNDRQRFFREARAAAQLRHPHIVPVFEVGHDGATPYIVAGLVEGKSLAEVLRHRKYSAAESVRLIVQLAGAVHFAHQKGIFHRDIKPANVLIDGAGDAHLTDFGLARRLEGEEAHTVPGEVLGTPAYMSPEQARGEGHAVDARSDLFSLGVVFYELLTGRRPFEGSVYEIIRQLLESEPIGPRKVEASVPRDLEAICLKALSKEPDQRYPSVLHFAEDLRRWQTNMPVHACRISPLTRAAKWTRRNKLTAAGLSALVVGLVAVATYFQTRPAYLDLRVSPAPTGTRVCVDGREIELDSQGRAVLPRRPGRARIEVHAPNHEPHDRQVVLVRGRDNAVVAEVELIPRFGYLHVASEPEGAAVEVMDKDGNAVARGATPFNSPRIPSGSYKVKLNKELYKPLDVSIDVPTGDRLTSAAPVKLEALLPHASSFEMMRTLRRRLGQKTSLVAKSVPLSKLFQTLATQERIAIVIDSRALREIGLDPETPITADYRDMPLDSLLRLICDPHNLTAIVQVQRDGSSWFLNITSAPHSQGILTTVVYPIKDLISIRGASAPSYDADSVLASLQSLIAPSSWESVGGPGTMRWEASTASLVVSQTWGVHFLIDDYLVNLREHRLGARQEPDVEELPEEQRRRRAATDRFIALGAAIKPNSYYPGYPLTGLDLRGCKVSEGDLPLVRHFPMLRRLDISECSVRGDFLESLPQSCGLSHLVATGTRLDDQSLANLARLRQLIYVDVGHTKVTDAGMAKLAELPRLRSLTIHSLPITDDGVAKLRGLRNLVYLNLSATKITDRSAEHLAAMPALTHVYLNVTDVSDSMAAALADRPSLQLLGLTGTKVTDQAASELVRANDLTMLYLGRTGISDAAVADLGKLTKLTALDLHATKITDEGLTQLKLPALTWLNLQRTAITDRAIPHLANMRTLSTLAIRGSKLTPQGVAELRRLLPRTHVVE